MTHACKTWKQYYKDQEAGYKLFELRKDDRPYKVGDYFLSQEFDQDKNEYTGSETKYTIAYILTDAGFYWQSDDEGNHPMDSKDIIQMYKNSRTSAPKQDKQK